MLHALVDLVLIRPLYEIYIHLPYFGWDGKNNSEICNELTGVTITHWDNLGKYECDNLIVNKFYSKVTLVKNVFILLCTATVVQDVMLFLRSRFKRMFFEL